MVKRGTPKAGSKKSVSFGASAVGEDALDVDAIVETAKANREIVDNIVAMGLMTFPNVVAAQKAQGESFDLSKMVEKETLLGWSCPCGNKPSTLNTPAGALRKAVIYHLFETKGKDGGAAHTEILAQAAPTRARLELTPEGQKRAIAEAFHSKAGKRFFGEEVT